MIYYSFPDFKCSNDPYDNERCYYTEDYHKFRIGDLAQNTEPLIVYNETSKKGISINPNQIFMIIKIATNKSNITKEESMFAAWILFQDQVYYATKLSLDKAKLVPPNNGT